jgi:hypothetical protein
MNPKLCTNCKFFKNDLFQDNKFGKCLKSPIVNDVDYFLVTGVNPSKKVDYNFCSIVRKYNPECGPDGKLFEPKDGCFSRKNKN